VNERTRRWISSMLPPLCGVCAIVVHWIVNVPPNIVREKPPEPANEVLPKREAEPVPEPREKDTLDELWERYADAPLDEEPELPGWANSHDAVVGKVVVIARTRAFEGAPESPEVALTETECRTIRCRFVLRGPHLHELRLLSETLSGLQFEGGSLWRHYEAKFLAGLPSDTRDESRLQVIVAFVQDAPDPDTITTSDTGGTAMSASEAETRTSTTNTREG